NAILSKYPLERPRMIRFPGIAKWFGDYQKRLGGRMALMATIRMPEPVLVVSTHLDSARADVEIRREQATMLVEALAGEACVILGGDLNAPPDEPAIQVLRDAEFVVDAANDFRRSTQQHDVDGEVRFGPSYIDYVALRGVPVIRTDSSPQVIPAVFPQAEMKVENLLGDHTIVTVLAGVGR
ncbi:MAG: hypothetical protein KDA21_08225, partial [Phycisphaerales bacterium]|nr:hypothetical protein [Phycisphaerales bacterium]